MNQNLLLFLDNPVFLTNFINAIIFIREVKKFCKRY